MDQVIIICEYSQSKEIDLSSLERDLIINKCKDKLFVVRPLSGDKYCIKSSSYVGVYEIGRYKILVEPKVSVHSVFKMLCYAYDLALFDDKYTKYENIDDLFEYLIQIFQKNVMLLVKQGLFANYIEENDDLKFIKGKININRLIRKNWQKTIINCDYDEFNADVLENQIVRFTLFKLLKKKFKNKNIEHDLKVTQRYFNEISLKQISISDISSVQYSILNVHYKPIHCFCKMILELIGIYEKEGTERFNAYSLDMNVLFEKYIGCLLKEKLHGFEIVLQDSQYLDEERGINTRLDIVVYKEDNPLLVFDTKYKTGDSASPNDIYQIDSYMNKLKVDGALLYPAYEIEEKIHNIGRRKLFVKTFDLDNLDRSADELIRWVSSRINDTVSVI